jgi:uncharacterized SAM-binding protein YcdF (DUF218 family)
MANKIKRRRIGFFRYLLLLLILLIGVWFIGFFIYLNKISNLHSDPLNNLEGVDAIVVLTGGSGRLE